MEGGAAIPAVVAKKTGSPRLLARELGISRGALEQASAAGLVTVEGHGANALRRPVRDGYARAGLDHGSVSPSSLNLDIVQQHPATVQSRAGSRWIVHRPLSEGQPWRAAGPSPAARPRLRPSSRSVRALVF
jgi:hypothetical protein